MTWWLWMVVGCALLVVETLAPGTFFFFFFGVGAILTGALNAFGIIDPDWLQWLMFSVLSVLFLIFFRTRLRASLHRRGHATEDVDGLIGLTGSASVAMGVNDVGNVEVRGANWTARNVGGMPLAIGQRCKVEKVDGITLLVKADS